MTPTTPTGQYRDEIDAILRDLHTSFLNIVGDEFAPKKEGGSPERQRLLGLLAETTPLTLEAEAKLSALLTRVENEAKQAELKNVGGMLISSDGQIIDVLLKDYVDGRIAALQAAQKGTG